MKRALLLFLVLSVIFAGCKKDVDDYKTRIVVKTTLPGSTNYVNGVNIKIYNLNFTPVSLVYEGFTAAIGIVDLRGLSGGQYKIEASYTDTVGGNINQYAADTTVELTENGTLNIDLVLECTNCCNLTCSNNGTLVNSNGTCTCNCDAGYEGTACDTLSRDKFLGTYDSEEFCGLGNFQYTAVISTSSSATDKVSIDNFGGFGIGETIEASIDGTIITLTPNQVVSGGGVTILNGSGTHNANTGIVTITYAYNDGTANDNCTASYTRQ